MFEVVAFWWMTRLKGPAARGFGLIGAFCGLLLLGSQAANAAPNWTLDPTASVITYQSVKKNTIVETNKIRNITGTLSSAVGYLNVSK
ncbi:MAG: flagellar motor protein MotB, partial [Mesorhizobium sp.]